MKHLKPYKIFESSEGLTPEEFCERYLPGSFGTNKHKIVNGEIQVEGDVHLFNKGLSEIPKFSSVTGLFDVRKNNLKSFEFLPEECGPFGGGPYLIHMNPYEGELKRIVELTQNRIGDGTLTIYKNLFDKFIKRCLEDGVWFEGKSNEYGIKEAWHDVKLDDYNENKHAFFFGKSYIAASGKSELLDLDDTEILEEQFGIDMSGDWVLELIEKTIEKIKSDDESERRFYFLFLVSLLKSDEAERIREVVEGTYDLREIYARIDSFKLMQERDLDKAIKLISKKLVRTDSERSRDDSHDLFVFIGRDKFVENEDGSYRKTLEVENFLKINIYNPEDLQMVNMMKIRARMQAGGSEVYMIWMPKGVFEEEKDSFTQEEISDFIDVINQKKTRIG
jgi:hypothetical protein